MALKFFSETPNSEEDNDYYEEDVAEAPTESGLMFVYQTAWMKRLLKRYGEMILLDATYKTTRYALPLFFVVVKTNIGYQVVAAFVIEGESTAMITSALEIIKKWNPDLNPTHVMLDCCKEEFNAVEAVFPGKILRTLLYIIF